MENTNEVYYVHITARELGDDQVQSVEGRENAIALVEQLISEYYDRHSTQPYQSGIYQRLNVEGFRGMKEGALSFSENMKVVYAAHNGLGGHDVWSLKRQSNTFQSGFVIEAERIDKMRPQPLPLYKKVYAPVFILS